MALLLLVVSSPNTWIMMRKESNPIFRMDLPTTSTAKKCCCCFWGWWCYVVRPSVGVTLQPRLHHYYILLTPALLPLLCQRCGFIYQPQRRLSWVVAMLLRNWKKDRVMLKKRDRFHERQTSSSRIDQQHTPTEEVPRSVPHFPKFPPLWGVQRFMDFHW